MTSPHSLVDELLALPDIAVQRQFLRDHAYLLDGEAADALKQQADHFLRSDVEHSMRVADLLQYAGEVTHKPLYEALGLIAEGNARSIGGLGEYERAIELYDLATSICQTHDLPIVWARAQLGKIFSLGYLGRFDEALAAGKDARRVLEKRGQWFLLGRLLNNLSIVHARMGQDATALVLLTEARDVFKRAGPEGELDVALIEPNRAAFLRNLGRFEESIESGQNAAEVLARLGHTVAAARAQLNVAVTYHALERYNEALVRLDDAQAVFLSDGRERDAIRTDLFVADCLLKLRRFQDVLSKCRDIRASFAELGVRFEVALAIINEAVAYTGLGQYDAARRSLVEARSIFAAEGNRGWVTIVDLQTAGVLHNETQYQESLDLAAACARAFRDLKMAVEEAEAYLTASRAALALNNYERARELAQSALTIGEDKRIPSLQHRAHHLLGNLSQAGGALEDALLEYERGIQQLEQLRSRLMVEFRADFVADKETIYEDIVDLAIDLDRPEEGLRYAERAKSRALLDMLAYRLDLSIQPRHPADRPLVDELLELQAERNRLHRRWESGEGLTVRGWSPADDNDQDVQQKILALEKRITDLWHKLLVHNADYARDAALWHVRAEKMQDYLPPGTMVLEYFTVHDRLIAFLVTRETVLARRLPWDDAQIQHLVRALRRNFALVRGSPPGQVPALAAHSRRILQDLHTLLLAPVADDFEPHPHIMIVPHGPLHYIPFQALHNGQSHLLERHTISYLPNGSLLRHLDSSGTPAAGEAWAFGHSQNGDLPHARQEAHTVAAVLNGQVVVDDDATLARLREAASNCQILHLATHGMFHPDNPLFSGLALAGGDWLTTLDVFNLPLSASLVTLSACETGQHVVGGGDELLGLMRAFLYAGAASLVLTHWAVEDRSTLHLMETFYRELQSGQPKADALRAAQVQFLRGKEPEYDVRTQAYTHPYFWAPFFLVGDPGTLIQMV